MGHLIKMKNKARQNTTMFPLAATDRKTHDLIMHVAEHAYRSPFQIYNALTHRGLE